MFFINRISYLLFNFTYVECSYLVANNLITKGTACLFVHMVDSLKCK